jgi:hypothetical protein
MEVAIDSDEEYPVYHWDTDIDDWERDSAHISIADVGEGTVARWKSVLEAYDAYQKELFELFWANTKAKRA